MAIKVIRSPLARIPNTPFLVESDTGELFIVSYVLFTANVPDEYTVNEIKVVNGDFVEICQRKNISVKNVTLYPGEIVLKNSDVLNG